MKIDETILDRTKRHWFSSLFFVAIFGAYLIGSLAFHLGETVQHILLTLTAVLGIHMLDRLYLYKDAEGVLNTLVQDVKTDITNQSKLLLNMSKSLDSMDRCGIVQVYSSRIDASEDIKFDMLDPKNTKIRMIGISLNDFIQAIDQNLSEVWDSIEKYAVGEKPVANDARRLDIKVMIIDPLSFGASLRSGSESETATALALRLDTDVIGAAEVLKKLQDKQDVKNTGVSIEARMYRLPPIMFLCWTDSLCYVHQYHFWSKRDNKTPIPTFKYRNLTASATTYPYHMELEHHFDWIWNHASISVSDFLEGKNVGVDEGTYKTAAINIYTDSLKARDRITYLLSNAKKEVVIQGISLKSYFDNGPLRESLSQLLNTGKIDINVLLLNPCSDQAKFRSYRERLFEVSDQKYDQYISGGEHQLSELYHDTNQTIKRIRHMVQELRRNHDSNWNPNLTVSFYDTAPACFLLKIDDHVFVEQYHYGKIARAGKAILGKDMPLVEYMHEPEELYSKYSDPLRMPYGLLNDHLKFVMKQATKQDLCGVDVQQENSEAS